MSTQASGFPQSIQSARLSFQSSKLGPVTRKRKLLPPPPPFGSKGETHSLAGEGVGGSNSDYGTDRNFRYT